MSKVMAKSNKVSSKVLPFVVPQASMEGKLEKWFRGVVQSNKDLITALDRLRNSYQTRVGQQMTEADEAVLLAAQITLIEARNAQNL
jgi:hypothetical protein